MHGMFIDMMSWVFNDPDVTPAFVLAKEGYDVWLGNNRGTRHSDQHITLDNESREYWQFSWEEYGTHDLPAFIDFIKNKTGNQKVNYIGYSAGTTQLLAGAALKPEYFNENIKSTILLAPVAAFNHNSILSQIIGLFIPLLGFPEYLETNKIYNWLPINYKER